ncbi:MAG: hypothetical protein RMY64_15165 [Nostoc sp. DedQUE08]|uniref:hypothetical protein n=1 Tax=Nostoc sp. DedQUE08 TaxID=3075393 RepID=UPI002AD295E8|nr:hypothetical protein [Nostoc sp. DedQUE08]MDZ8066939.1 hypothetical protein [Nostoc sp. DedQUE08]
MLPDGAVIALKTGTSRKVDGVTAATTVTIFPNFLELIRKENLKDTQLIARSEFQRISAVLT